MKKLIALTAAACLLAAPISLAQTPTQQQPQTPPTTQQPGQVPTPTPQPGPEQPATTPPSTSADNSSQPQGTAQCRTRKTEGEQCSCLSAPTDFGVAARAETGSHNMCMVPESAPATTTEQ